MDNQVGRDDQGQSQGLGGLLSGGLRGAASSIVEDLRNIVRGEVKLAATQLKDDARQVGKAAGLIGGSGVLAFTGFIFLMLGVTHLLNRRLSMWASATVVGAVLVSVAGILGMVGKTQVQRASLRPEQNIESLEEDAQLMRDL